MEVKEKEIENEILNFLNTLPGCFAFKVTTTGFYDAKRRVFRKNLSKFIIRGTSDILGIFRGRMIAIEVKSSRGLRKYLKNPGEHELNQRAFLEKVVEMGGIGICASSLEEVLFQIK